MMNCKDGASNSPVVSPRFEELLNLAASGLSKMFHPESQLFCYRRRLSPAGLVNEGLSPRYTIMSLLGLARYQASGWPARVDIRGVLRGSLAGTEWIHNVGDLGLLLWLHAAALPESVRDLCASVNLKDVLQRFPQALQGSTTELAWLLAGLAHVRLSLGQDLPDLREVAFDAYQLVGENQGPTGIFGHYARNRSLAGRLRGHIGSFADQVYPIYALAKFGQAYGVEPALERARRCGEAICRVQGPSGQWWWHYEARTGRVFERYPVYSVHQHGMAPMALFALEEATGGDFSAAIYKGLRWVTETNELGTDLADRERQIIWRGVYRGSKWRVYTTRALSLLGKEDRSLPVNDLPVRFECRPYELGWLLYAFAGCAPGLGGSQQLRDRKKGTVSAEHRHVSP